MGWLRLDIVKLLLLALPALALNWWLVGSTGTFSEEPGRVVTLLVVLGVLTVVLAVFASRDAAVNLGGGFLLFFPVFCLFFSLATATDLLTGKRVLLAGHSERVPRNFLGLSRLGDWHYRFATEAPPAHDFLIVTLPSFAGEARAQVRRRFAFLIDRATEHDAKGIAFDYFLEKPSEFDGQLAGSLERAKEQAVPVFFGYRYQEVDGELERRDPAASLADAIPVERQGHLSGYRESDGRVRMVPIGPHGNPAHKALSHKIAEQLHGGELPAPGRLLQYTRPRFGVPVEEFSPTMDFGRFRHRFVLVGTSSETDRVDTPYGEMQGVEVHAFAVNSLRSGHSIRHLDERFAFPLLFAACYLLTLFYVRGHSVRFLILAALTLGVVLTGFAALAMREDLLWIDVSYPLVGLGSLLALLLTIRVLRMAHGRALGGLDERPAIVVPEPDRLAAGDARPGSALDLDPPGNVADPPTGPGEGSDFDVFLSHNSQDKPRVRELGQALIARRLRPWLDEWELVPGRSWQDDLENILRTVRSSAVLVGAGGLGPWEIPEIRASLSESVRRGLPVIPVLLPGAAKQPVLPLFLTQFTWVDLRGGLTEAGLDRLEWGITGVKPAGETR